MNTPNIAQAMSVPPNGASNARDFQPETRNPQNAPAQLQPGTPAQQAGGAELLRNQDARIIVPGSTSQNNDVRMSAARQTNEAWLIVLVILGVLVAYLVARRMMRRANQAGAGVTKEELGIASLEATEPDMATEPSLDPISSQAEVPAAPAPIDDTVSIQPATTQPQKKKSKSKRKKARK